MYEFGGDGIQPIAPVLPYTENIVSFLSSYAFLLSLPLFSPSPPFLLSNGRCAVTFVTLTASSFKINVKV